MTLTTGVSSSAQRPVALRPYRRFVAYSEVAAMEFSQNGNALVCASVKTDRRRSFYIVERLVLKTGKSQRTLIPQHPRAIAMILSSDATTLLTSDGKVVRFWDTSTGRLKQQLYTGAKSMALSNDGHILAVASGLDPKIQPTIRLWDLRTNQWLRTLSSHDVEAWNDLEVKSVCFSRDGKTLASANGNYTVCLWDVKTGRLIKFAWAGVEALISPDSLHIAVRRQSPIGPAAESETTVYCDGLELYTAPELKLKDVLTLSDTPANGEDLEWLVSMAFSPDGKQLAAGVFGGSRVGETIRFYDADSGKLIGKFEETHGVPTLLAFSPDGNYLVSAIEKTVTVRTIH